MRDGAATMKRVTPELGGQIAGYLARRRRAREGDPGGPRHRISEQWSSVRRRRDPDRGRLPGPNYRLEWPAFEDGRRFSRFYG